jgi:hypothetical protein
MNRRSTARSSLVGWVAEVQSSRRAGSRVRSVERARCSALLTDGTLVPSSAATSLADQPSTSRS